MLSPVEIAAQTQREWVIERIQDMTFEELVHLGNAITEIKRNSIRAGKRQPRKRERPKRTR